jgi:hypothetical protein
MLKGELSYFDICHFFKALFEMTFLNGVPSGKCGFTTLRKFPYKKA